MILGIFYYAHGQLGDAFKSYVRACDYCTTSKHIVHMCMGAIWSALRWANLLMLQAM